MNLRPINPLASFDGRYNPPPKPEIPLPAPVLCRDCQGTGHGLDDRCATCAGTGRVRWVGGAPYPDTLKGKRKARVYLRREGWA